MPLKARLLSMSDVDGSCQTGEQVPKHEKRISPQQNLGSVPAHSELAAAGQTWFFSFLSRDLGPLLETEGEGLTVVLSPGE